MFEHAGDDLDIRADAARPAEFPKLLGGPVVVMDRFVDGIAVDLTSAIAVQLFGDMLNEVGQSSFVVGSHEGARSPSICLGAHARHLTVATRRELVRGTGGISSQVRVKTGSRVSRRGTL